MSDTTDPRIQIAQLQKQYAGEGVSDSRLLELVNSCLFHKRAASGRLATVYHDLVLALLELERGRSLGWPGALPSILETAAEELLSLVQDKHQPLSHPDNLRLTEAGDTILVNEARLWALQLALQTHQRRNPRSSAVTDSQGDAP